MYIHTYIHIYIYIYTDIYIYIHTYGDVSLGPVFYIGVNKFSPSVVNSAHQIISVLFVFVPKGAWDKHKYGCYLTELAVKPSNGAHQI